MSDHNKPPEMPPFERRVKIPVVQMIGMAFIIAIPVLALFGLFGETRNTIKESNDSLDVTVTYPTMFRYKLIDTVDITIENTSEGPWSTVALYIDQDYIKQFSTVQFTPSVKTVSEEHYLVELQDVAPGESRVVSITIQAEEYGQHESDIRIEAEGAEPVTVSISTIALP